MTVPEDRGERCEECGRERFRRGVMLDIEAAIDPQGGAQIVPQLDALRRSADRSERRRWADINERFKQLAAYGRLVVPREMRVLSGTLWEIKTAEDRIPFYTRREDESHRAAARLTFQFAKDSGKTATGKTPRKYIDRGLWIMKGDIERDANNGR